MLHKIRAFAQKHSAILVYLLIGGVTTLINFTVYMLLCNLVGLSVFLSNCAAWFASVIFAFLLNKPLVFRSYDWSLGVTLKEYGRFIACRLLSGLAETLLLVFLVDVAGAGNSPGKLLSGVFVIVFNYLGSRLFVFRH